MKKALITGITGQDGSYLADFLLEKDYQVHGLVRRASTFNTERIDHLYKDPKQEKTNLYLHYGDMSDASNLNRILEKVEPDEVYNLAAQSHVRISFELPEYTSDISGLGTLRILDAIKNSKKEIKFYQASSSEMYGNVKEEDLPINEDTIFQPCSPYACAKLFSYWITKNYRESYNMFTVNGILFNHESPRRGETFVTRKITRGLARIKLGKDKILLLGNLYAKRDWGYAPDFVEGMYLMMQSNKADDYVLATNETHTVKEFVNLAAKYLDIDLVWEGTGLNEKGIDKKSGKIIVGIDKNYFRPSEVDILIGDYSKAKKDLNWSPKTSFNKLVEIMTKEDFKKEKKYD